MKVIISGPRSAYWDMEREPSWPHMKIELDLEQLPAEGEHIILNDGASYVVKRRMWWVDAPENEAYWGRGEYEAQGQYQIAYLDVLPTGYDEPFTPDKMLAQGREEGREQAMAEVEALLALDPPGAVELVRSWCRDGAAAARERAAENERRAETVKEILAELERRRKEWQQP